MSPWFGKKDPPTPLPSVPAAKPVAGRTKAVKVSSLLTQDTILLAPPGMDKNRLLESLVAKLCAVKGYPSSKPFLEKVMEREQGISTTLDTGLSLPHARMDDLPSLSAALAVVAHGIADPKQQELTIRVMFLFFSPNKPEAFPLHLQLLRCVSSLFQPAFIDQLCRATSPAAVMELVRKVEG